MSDRAGEDSDDPRLRDGRPASAVVIRQLHVGALAAYRRLPVGLKRWLAGWLTPSFQVAAGSVVQRGDGAILLVRHSYRRGWGIPGGFVKRREHPWDAAAREATEELGISIEAEGDPIVIVSPEDRRILVAYPARLLADDSSPDPSPQSPEITETAWFARQDLPRLQVDVVHAVRELGGRR